MDNPFLDTRQVSEYLGINEKQVYTLIAERGLPGTKITGKWLFPRHLVDRWVEAHVLNLPGPLPFLERAEGLLLIAGSDDPLLARLVALFRRRYSDIIPLQSRAGSSEGLMALKRGLCHIACVHLLNPGGEGYNTEHLSSLLGDDVVGVSFATRRQGILLPKGNPGKIRSLKDAAGRPWARREVGTGTRLLFDRLIDALDLDPADFSDGPAANSHLEVGLAVLQKRAEAGLGIEAVAGILDLDFVALQEERFDLAIRKPVFFGKTVQSLLALLGTEEFHGLAQDLAGYDISEAGRILAVV